MDSIMFSAGTKRQIAPQDWHSEIIAGEYGAVIFDCDGTLVDSSEAHYQSFRAAVRAQGYDLDREWYSRRNGLDRQSLLVSFASSNTGAFDVALASKQSIEVFISGASAVAPIDETASLVRTLAETYPMAVGTNAERDVATASLQAVNLLDYFDTIVSISDGLAAKPAPDIFAYATQKLGFRVAKTLVFEDSAEGVSAAIAAGADVIQVIHS